MDTFLDYYLLGAVFVFGAIIGSFLNVVIYRFHTGKSIGGSSHCLSCLEPLMWYELFPLVSYLCLRGRCRTCASYIPPRYFLVELVTALVFLSIYLVGGTVETMFLMAVLAGFLIVVAVYDIYHFIIPNELVVLVALVVASNAMLELYNGTPIASFLYNAQAAAAAFIFYGGLWKISKGRWIGFGDAKLALPLGFYAGVSATFSMIVLSFWVGAAVSLLLLGLQALLNRGQIHLQFFGAPLKMKSEIPFAPFLILGFVLSAIYGVDVLELVSYVL